MEVKDWTVLIDSEGKDYETKKLFILEFTKDENSHQQQQRLQRFRKFRNQRIAECSQANYIDHLHEVDVMLQFACERQFEKDCELRLVSAVDASFPNTHVIYKSLP